MNWKFWKSKKLSREKVVFEIRDYDECITLCSLWDAYKNNPKHSTENFFIFWRKVEETINLEGCVRVLPPEFCATRIIITAFKWLKD